MSKLKSYSCAKCGAVLSVDKLQGQMACPFCGNEFDYIDFHRDELIRQAEECLERGAYEPAREKFNKVIENNPKDIEAYRGLILCECKVQTTEDLRDRYDQVSSHLDAIKEIVSSAKKHVTEEDAGYLDNLVSLFEIPKAYKNIEGRRKATRELERKHDIQEKVREDIRDILYRPVLSLAIALVLGCFALCFADYGEPLLMLRDIIVSLHIAGVIVGVTVLLFRVLLAKKVIKITDSSRSLSKKMAYVEKTHTEILSQVLEYENGFRKKPEEKVMKSEEKKQEPEAVITGPVICAKCGGMLKLNTAQELYECNSCGVSYGKYLFFGDLTANAVKAMNMGEYDEADQIFSHKLTLNPKDFEAVLGRFLCAGRWKSLKDIDLDDRLIMSRVRKLPDKLDTIEKSISADDHPLWEYIRKLSDLLSEYADRRHAYNRVYEKYKSVNGKLNDSPLLSKEIEGYQRQKDELEEKVAVLEGECRETGVRINEVIEILSDAGY